MEEDILQKKAVALQYDTEHDEAPKVVAKGKGTVAQRIEEIARDAGVPIKKDEELINYLHSLDLYEQIPPFLYEVVAEVLAFVYRMDKNKEIK